MDTTPPGDQTTEEQSALLDKIVQEYHKFKASGQDFTARGLAIEQVVPAGLRSRDNGDYDPWWRWLDKRIEEAKK